MNKQYAISIESHSGGLRPANIVQVVKSNKTGAVVVKEGAPVEFLVRMEDLIFLPKGELSLTVKAVALAEFALLHGWTVEETQGMFSLIAEPHSDMDIMLAVIELESGLK